MCSFSDHLQVSEHSVLNHLGCKEGSFPALGIFEHRGRGVVYVLQVRALHAEGHVRVRASANTLSRTYGDRLGSVTTSTEKWSKSSKSCLIAMRSSRLRPASSVTSRSRSLSGRASPLARDPKIRTDSAPCERATRTMSETGSTAGVTPIGYDGMDRSARRPAQQLTLVHDGARQTLESDTNSPGRPSSDAAPSVALRTGPPRHPLHGAPRSSITASKLETKHHLAEARPRSRLSKAAIRGSAPSPPRARGAPLRCASTRLEGTARRPRSGRRARGGITTIAPCRSSSATRGRCCCRRWPNSPGWTFPTRNSTSDGFVAPSTARIRVKSKSFVTMTSPRCRACSTNASSLADCRPRSRT